MDSFDFLEELNEQQRTAAEITEGYLRVIAGAGSGKTKLLVSRYAYLVECLGIDPSNILCVTFTNKAAGEMRSRIRSIIGEGYDTSLISTYHGFCARLLREDSEKFEYPRDFRILDESGQKDILNEIYESMELKLDHASFEKMLARIGAVKGGTTYIKGIINPGVCRILPAVVSRDDEIVEKYLQKQKALFALDFDDLINFALYVLEKYDNIREKWQEKLNYIQVDEFQDSSCKEMELVDLLSGRHKNVMIVGDPDQNIYEWRGSDVRLLVDFDKTHPNTETVFLNRNYRSTPQILSCANLLIAKNKYRLEKDLYTLEGGGLPVVHFHAKNSNEEMKWIADKIESVTKDKKTAFSDIAVLYRSSFLSRGVENILMERNIPYEIIGGVSFYQRMEIRDAVAYLRLTVFDDNAAFERIVNKPRRRFGRVKSARLKALKADGISLFDTLCDNINDSVLRASGAADFVQVVKRARGSLGKKSVADITDSLLSESGYEAYIRELGDMERFENLAEFKRIAHEFEKSAGEKVTMSDFLSYIALQNGIDSDAEKDRVKLMTVHASKGLEFPVVFIVGMSDGIMPSSRTLEERKLLGLEEERRLCYVAITRAMRELYFTESESGAGSNASIPSRFLRDIGEENYQRIGSASKDVEALFRQRMKSFAAFENDTAELGDITGSGIIHPVFGRGVVEAYNDKNDTYTVNFEQLKTPRNMGRRFISKCRLMDISDQEFINAAETAEAFKANENLNGSGLPHERKNLHNTGALQETASCAISGTDTYAEIPLPDRALQTVSIQENDASPVHIEAKQSPDFIQSLGFKQNGEDVPAHGETEDNVFRRGLSINEETCKSKNKKLKYENTEEMDSAAEEAVLPEEAEELKYITNIKELTDDPNETNLWKRSDVPHSGWVCTGVSDLGAPSASCGMCGKQIIRYVHHMRHPEYRRSVGAGCVCAGKNGEQS